MTGRILVCTSSSDDPFLNLALEDQLFRRMGTEDRILFLWQSRPCVVIGRFQNPWVECHLEELERDGADLVRRQSGGGTVYHDRGNSNFTFLGPAASFDADENLAVVTAALAALGIKADISPRHDILVNGLKVSGSAFKKKRDRVLHHGTLLIAADKGKLSRYLAAPGWNIEAKGVASVKSPVINLSELQPGLDHPKFCEAVVKVFLGRADASVLPVSGLAEDVDGRKPLSSLSESRSWPSAAGGMAALGASDLDGEGKAFRQNLESWEWRFGKTPAFTHRMTGLFEGKSLMVDLQVREGRIAGVFSGTEEAGTEEADMAAFLTEKLTGVRYGRREITAALAAAGAVKPRGLENRGTEEPVKWFLSLLEGW